MSPGSLELIRRVQQEDGLVETLAQIANTWRATALIHGDIKLDNILLQGATGGEAGGALAVYFVDWELAQIGDPAWDVGGALRDFIFFWVISMPGGLANEEMADQARFPLDHLQPAIAALWQGYCDAAAVSAAEAETLLARSIGLSAFRMIQTALDMAGGFPEVPAPADLLLRVAVNLLADPGRARCDLFGLPVAGAE
jgi:aminoglycoside phosphotransferase (APT) family kinase protein